jgi:hypothetical protein
MRKYLSLGSAMMVGVVLGKEEKRSPYLAMSHAKKHKEAAKINHLEGAFKIPGFHQERSVDFTPDVEGRDEEAWSSVSRSVERPKKNNRRTRK